MEPQSQMNFEKEEQIRMHHASWFQIYYKAVVIKSVWFCWKMTQRQNTEPRNKLTSMAN